jgi:hypothetical protein
MWGVAAAQSDAVAAAVERDGVQLALDAARAEAVTSATQLAHAVKREQTSTKVGGVLTACLRCTLVRTPCPSSLHPPSRTARP